MYSILHFFLMDCGLSKKKKKITFLFILKMCPSLKQQKLPRKEWQNMIPMAERGYYRTLEV